MRTLISAAVLAGLIVSAGMPAEAQYYLRRDDTRAIIGAGIVGLALGAVISSRGNGAYDRPPGYQVRRGYGPRPYPNTYQYRPQCRIYTWIDPAGIPRQTCIR